MVDYRIVQLVDVGWQLYRDDVLVDLDEDAELADLDVVIKWAENVIYYDDRVRVRSWRQMAPAGEGQQYRAELEWRAPLVSDVEPR